MAAATFDVQYTSPRNRLTTAFRIILAIPHLVVSNAWQSLAQVLGVVQWFSIVFTGKRNRSIHDLQYQYLQYSARVNAYTGLLSDPWPPFGTAPANTGVSVDLVYDDAADRLRNGLRLIWAIPALFIMIGLGIAAFVVTVVSWFAILFTGNQPRGQFDFLVKVHRYGVRLSTYLLLMTDTYPQYE